MPAALAKLIDKESEMEARIIESEELSGLEALLGENVLLLCANYFYSGKLAGVNKSCVELENPCIVYETGAWDNKAYTDVQKLQQNFGSCPQPLSNPMAMGSDA